MKIAVDPSVDLSDPKAIVAALDAMVNTEGGHRRLSTIGCASYCLRCEGLPWKKVAENLSQKTDTSIKCAKGFALLSGLPWPVPKGGEG